MTEYVLNLAAAAFAAFLAGLTTAVGWLVARVLGAREDSLRLEGRCLALEARCVQLEGELKDVKAQQLTQECVRTVIDEALERRDDQAEMRRRQWDENLALKIQSAVVEGIATCQAKTRAELERMVPRIVREVCNHQHGNNRPSSDLGSVE